MREETVYESDLIGEEQAESQAQHTGRRREMMTEEFESSGVGDGNRDGRCHQHHAGNGAKAENEKVSPRPNWSLDDGQNQKRDCSRARESMHDPDDNWP